MNVQYLRDETVVNYGWIEKDLRLFNILKDNILYNNNQPLVKYSGHPKSSVPTTLTKSNDEVYYIGAESGFNLILPVPANVNKVIINDEHYPIELLNYERYILICKDSITLEFSHEFQNISNPISNDLVVTESNILLLKADVKYVIREINNINYDLSTGIGYLSYPNVQEITLMNIGDTIIIDGNKFTCISNGVSSNNYNSKYFTYEGRE